MTGSELESLVSYTGQERAIRQLCLDRQLIPPEKLALMGFRQVCSVVANEFEFIGMSDRGQTILIAEKSKIPLLNEHIVRITR